MSNKRLRIGKRVYTPGTLATEINRAAVTVWRWCRSGDLPAIQIGRNFYIPEDVANDCIARVRAQDAARQTADVGAE